MQAIWSADWLFYALGLVAAGLLPVKKRLADCGVSLVLACLWGMLLYHIGRSSQQSQSYVWVALAVLESLLLFVLGTWGRLRFPARSGAWAVVGTALIFYSLIAFPILARIFDPFEESVFGTPFPLVLLTCGILFFAAGWIASLALVVPLVWALLGGPGEAASSPEIWGLRLVLLAGTYFALLPPELRSGSERSPSPGADYRFAHKSRVAFGYGLWALVLITLFLLFSVFFEGGAVGDTQMGRVTINLTLLSAFGIVLWLAFPAWQSLWFRYVAWWVVRAWGRTSGAWRWGAFLLTMAVLVASWQVQGADGTEEKRTGGQRTEPTSGQAGGAAGKDQYATEPSSPALLEREVRTPWGSFELETLLLPILLTAALLGLIYLAYRGRKRLVIGTFSDYSGASNLKDWVPGLGPRLQNELARIADLYKTIDEARPPQQGSPVIEVTPSVRDVGDILRDAAGTDPIKLGPIRIPTNLLLGFVGWLVSGPRLTGALHKVEKEFVLTAELSGGGLAANWLVDSSKLTEEEKGLPDQAVIHKLIEELAFRIVTRLVSIGSPRWRAVRCFTEGLRFYRETQRKEKDRSRNLREAESCLIRALNDDNKFAQCHYNLGVVYRRLGELGSAESAFRRVLIEDPDNFEACYALAETSGQGGNHREAVRFCEAAIAINSADARAWNLKAYAQRERAQEIHRVKVALPPVHSAWTDILEMTEIAVALAWRALCQQALRGSSEALQKETDTAFLCTRNLAILRARVAHYPESERLFQQAAWLAPHDPDLRLYEGRTLFWKENWDGAANILEGVLDDGLAAQGRGLLWSLLARTRANSSPGTDRRDAVRLAHNRFLDLAADASAEDLQKFLDFSLELPPSKEKAREQRP